MKKLVLAVPVLALALGGTTACATKKFVRDEGRRSERQGRVRSRSPLEENQERTKANEAQDRRSRPEGAVGRQAADTKAAAAGQRADGAKTAADAANTQADAIEKASQAPGLRSGPERGQGQLQVRQGDDAGRSEGELDQLVAAAEGRPERRLHRDRRPHRQRRHQGRATTSSGSSAPRAVKRYLYEHHQVPLHKINVISYGEDKPVAPNKTKDGRAQNRRVVIKVLA